MPSPSLDTLATILDTVQKLAKRMDCLENRENVRRGAMGWKRKADLQLDNNKRPKPSCSTAMDVDTENPSPDHIVQTDCQRQGESEGGEDIFHDMAASFDSDEDWVPPVSDRLAELLERHFGSKLPDRKIKEKLTAHRILANCCKSMGVLKTNQEVFSIIPPFVRKVDVRMRNTQLSLTKAAVAITCCTDQLLKLCDSLSTLDVTKPMPDTTAQLKQKTTECIANLADTLALQRLPAKTCPRKEGTCTDPTFTLKAWEFVHCTFPCHQNGSTPRAVSSTRKSSTRKRRRKLADWARTWGVRPAEEGKASGTAEIQTLALF